MRFDFTDDQHEIKRIARDLLARRSPLERVRAAAEDRRYDPALYEELVALGWAGIAIAQEHGGQGLGMVELVILAEELGYALAATPWLATVAAAAAIQVAGDADQRARWLPGLASGAITGALGGDGGLVGDADAAAVIALADGDRALALLARADAEVTPVESIDPTRRAARVAALPGRGTTLGAGAAAAIDHATVIVAAELVGVAQRALDMTVAYVKERRQFGTPVGAYQGVSHACARMLKDTEGARSATYFAAWVADAVDDPVQLAHAASLAKAAASDGARDVTAAAIQAHGGVGFTWEADVHWLYKRAQVDAALLGGAARHRARLAALLVAGHRRTAA